MPNWCNNVITIEGHGNNVIPFLKACRGLQTAYFVPEGLRKRYGLPQGQTHEPKEESAFTFNALVPVPQDVLDKGYSDAGYYWQADNWGTKWDVTSKSAELTCYIDGKDTNLEVEELPEEAEELALVFTTAWAPPMEWFKAAAKRFPELTFMIEYDELGMMFAGRVVLKGEQELENEHVEGDQPLFWEISGMDREEWIEEEA